MSTLRLRMENSMKTDTPRTDAARAAWEWGLGNGPSVSRDFARQLERELAAMTEAAKQAVMERDYYQARAKELETLLVKTIKTPPSFPC